MVWILPGSTNITCCMMLGYMNTPAHNPQNMLTYQIPTSRFYSERRKLLPVPVSHCLFCAHKFASSTSAADAVEILRQTHHMQWPQPDRIAQHCCCHVECWHINPGSLSLIFTNICYEDRTASWDCVAQSMCAGVAVLPALLSVPLLSLKPVMKIKVLDKGSLYP